jgi:putative ABC transport system permease protein
MSVLRQLLARVIALTRTPRLDAELEEELATHLAEAAEEHRRRGLTDAAARAAAMRDFGGLTQTREAYKDVRGFPLIQHIGQDVRYALRILRKTPAFAAAAILTLALGIGANTAIFTVIDALILRSLPVRDPQQLVTVGDPSRVHSWSTGTPRTDSFSFPLYREVRDRNVVFSSVLASCRLDNLEAAIDGAAEDTTGRLVTENYFETLGVEPFIGRVFTAADGRSPGADPYVVISYRYWQRRFSADPSVVGRTIHLKNFPFTIIGVAPPEFFGEVVGDRPDIWAPMMMEPQLVPGRDFLESPNTAALLLMGRLKPGVTLAQARANVAAVVRQALTETLSARLSADDRAAIRHRNVRLDPPVSGGALGLSRLRNDFSAPLLLLMAIVALVLLVACVNVANLMLARSAARRREIAVRLALGASGARVVRQLLTEGTILAVAGGALGLLLANWGAAILVRLATRATSTPLVIGADTRVLAFTAIVSLAAGLLFGLAPALEYRRADLTSSLKDAGRGTAGSAAAARMRRTLVVGQIAFGVVVIMAAGLLVHSLRNLQSVNLGYRPGELLVARVDLTGAGYGAARAQSMTRELIERLGRIPGVGRVTVSSNGLFSGSESADAIRVEGFATAEREDLVAHDDEIGPDYFSAIGAPIVRGREITTRDFDAAAHVAVVNETFARFYFGNRNPLGYRIAVEDSDHPDAPPYEIVGVVADVRDHHVRGNVERRFYAPITSGGFTGAGALNFEIRTTGRPAALMDPVRRTIRAADPALVIDSIKPADALVGTSLASQTLVAQLSLAFGVLVLVLICIGIYGSISYGVACRTNEIGVRLALGASRGSIVRMVVRDASVMVAAGIVAGIPFGIAGTRIFATLLFGVRAADPATIAATAAAIVATAMVAVLLPARRATSVDPMLALRQD